MEITCCKLHVFFLFCIFYQLSSVAFLLFLKSFFCIGSIQEHGTAWSEMSRRDMLSLNVEFIKITVSRTRKLEVRMDLPSHLSKHEPQLRSNVVRFSGKYS